MVVRDEALRLPCALRHLWKLGVDRVLLVDNRSTDGTREIAAGDERVHLVDAPGSYSASEFGIAWANALLDRYARGHWVLVVDADELLVFPGSERPGALRALCRHLDAIGSEALLTFLLDCFPAEPLRDLRFRSGDDLTAAAPWFEPPALRREPSEHFPYVQEFGGLRERVFFPEADPKRPGRLVHQKLWNLVWRVPALRASERRPGVRAEAVAQPRQGAAGAVARGRGPGLLDAHAPAHGGGAPSSRAACCCTSSSCRTSTRAPRTRSPGTRISTGRASTAATWKR